MDSRHIGLNPGHIGLSTVITLDDESAWLAGLESAGGYDTYHLPAYQRLATPDGCTSVLLTYESEGVHVALPLTLRPLPAEVRRATGYEYDATSVYGYPGPVCDVPADNLGEEWRRAFADWFTKVCAELSVLSVFVRTNPLLDASGLFTTGPFVPRSATPTVAVDLTLGREERLARASAHHRRALRKSAQHGLTFVRDHSASAVTGFTTCYLETMAKHNAADSYLLDEARVRRMLTELGEHAELWVARKPDGEVASAAIFLRTNGIVQYHLGGTRTADYALGAARPLFEAVAEESHRRGDRWLHLGGGVGGDNDSLLRFKGGFGPDRFTYRTITAVLDEEAYRAAARAVGLDPDRAFFPAYRTAGLGV
ncbi:acetyltransferase (GNAT) family protein [Thermasporomyces composti]|jgi:hypothetical protein|uniref:Acetyltransferase (GNAT) family protein n=1 Tax=Thermasporomyces composti TaxID=696763 RepID=A0A3D9V5D7_THECX|nr:acetyltransferase (GNAT) family protein [Thermasporomyces composti]